MNQYSNRVKILYPKNGCEVGKQCRIDVDAQIYNSSNLWVLLHLKHLTGRWWPQPKPEKNENGDWSPICAFIGELHDIDFEFEIAAACFNTEAEKEIWKYIERGNRTQQWVPIKFPKADSNIYRVTVIKKDHTSFTGL